MTQLKRMEIRTLPIQLHQNDNEKLSVSGYVNVTGSFSEPIRNSNGEYFRETIEQGVFNNALGRASRVDFLAEHDTTKILATTENSSLELNEDSKGLFMSAKISPTSWGKDAYQLIIDGIIQGLSFGMIVLDQDWSVCDDGTPLRTIRAIELFEVSAVRHPAYKSSSVEARGIEQINDIEIPKEYRNKESESMANKKAKEPEDNKKVDPKTEDNQTQDTEVKDDNTSSETKDPKKNDGEQAKDTTNAPKDESDSNKKEEVKEDRANEDGIASLSAKLDKVISLLESKNKASEKRDDDTSDDSDTDTDDRSEDKKTETDKKAESRSLEDVTELTAFFDENNV